MGTQAMGMSHRTTVYDEYDYQNRGAFGTVALQDLSRTSGSHRIEGVSGRAFGSGLAPR
jgi:hypothetical protein